MLLDQLREPAEHLVAHVVTEHVVDELEVVEISDDDGQRGAEGRSPCDLAAERLEEMAPVHESREIVRDRLSLHEVVQAGVLQRDRGLGGKPLGQLPHLRREASGAGIKKEIRPALAASGKLDHERGRSAMGLTGPADLLTRRDDPPTAGLRRVDDDLENDREQRARIVGGGQRAADQRKRLAGLTSGHPPDRSAASIPSPAWRPLWVGTQQAEEQPEGRCRREDGKREQGRVSKRRKRHVFGATETSGSAPRPSGAPRG